MTRQLNKRWLALGLGAAVVTGGTVAISSYAMAAQQPQIQGQGQPRQPRQPGQPGQPGGEFGQGGPGFGGGGGGFGPGGGGFPGGGGGFGGRGMMMGMPGGGGGGPTVTATANAVYVLRGNTLFAFSPTTLKMIAKTELPQPEGMPGGPGGPGFPGGPGGAPGGFGNNEQSSK